MLLVCHRIDCTLRIRKTYADYARGTIGQVWWTYVAIRWHEDVPNSYRTASVLIAYEYRTSGVSATYMDILAYA